MSQSTFSLVFADLKKKDQKSPKFDCQSEFSTSKIILIILKILIRLAEQPVLTTLFDNFNFWQIYFLKVLSTHCQVNPSPTKILFDWIKFLRKKIFIIFYTTS